MSNQRHLPKDVPPMYTRWGYWNYGFSMFPARFTSETGQPLQFKIGDTIYYEYSEEFRTLYDKMQAWDVLRSDP